MDNFFFFLIWVLGFFPCEYLSTNASHLFVRLSPTPHNRSSWPPLLTPILIRVLPSHLRLRFSNFLNGIFVYFSPRAYVLHVCVCHSPTFLGNFCFHSLVTRNLQLRAAYKPSTHGPVGTQNSELMNLPLNYTYTCISYWLVLKEVSKAVTCNKQILVCRELVVLFVGRGWWV